MTAVATTQNQAVSTQLSPGLVTHLRQLSVAATEPRYPTQITRALVLAGTDEASVRGHLVAMLDNLKPATAEQIVQQLLTLEVFYPSLTLSRDQSNLRFQIWCEDLKDVPAEVLSRACERYRKATNPPNEFFPKPGHLLALCAEELAAARRQRVGLETIAQVLTAPTEPDANPVQRERRMSAEHAQELIAKTRAKYGYRHSVEPERKAEPEDAAPREYTAEELAEVRRLHPKPEAQP